ncbi:hypothetical protein ACHWQZ_G017621 [Mnemiopsis leidyi]
MEDIRKAGLPFFTSVLDEVPPLNVKRRKVEISPFVQVDFIEKEDDPEDLNEEDDLTYDDQVEEVDPENTVPTPFGHLPHSQADRILLNAGGVRLNNISRKGCLLGVSVTLRTLSPVAGQLSLLASKTLELDGCLSVVRKGRQDGKQLSDLLKLRSGWWVRAFFYTANSVN